MYFSPSDQTTQQIARAIQNAQFQASFCIFSFTKNEIGAAFVSEHQTGTWVRGMIENIGDPGEEYSVLLNAGVPVKAHPAPTLLHHKYAVLDAGYPASDPTVLTGSHNWTQAAESSNDENTLILHDANLATLFQAEFERRWGETGASVAEIAGTAFDVYPNPASDRLLIRCRDGGHPSGAFEIRDMGGRPVLSGVFSGSGTRIQLPDALPAGAYVLVLQAAGGVVAVRFSAGN
ncbi:MAG: T9SS type A sorting domain-containing protein [Saprospirales bacterium]|nr:T9SS type A sorting domain-containing protein [Saprospirales bacterium]